MFVLFEINSRLPPPDRGKPTIAAALTSVSAEAEKDYVESWKNVEWDQFFQFSSVKTSSLTWILPQKAQLLWWT